jgi:hypothetical protein
MDALNGVFSLSLIDPKAFMDIILTQNRLKTGHHSRTTCYLDGGANVRPCIVFASSSSSIVVSLA